MLLLTVSTDVSHVAVLHLFYVVSTIKMAQGLSEVGSLLTFGIDLLSNGTSRLTLAIIFAGCTDKDIKHDKGKS